MSCIARYASAQFLGFAIINRLIYCLQDPPTPECVDSMPTEDFQSCEEECQPEEEVEDDEEEEPEE